MNVAAGLCAKTTVLTWAPGQGKSGIDCEKLKRPDQDLVRLQIMPTMCGDTWKSGVHFKPLTAGSR